MKAKEKLKDTLKDILEQYGEKDKVLFQLRHKNMLHIDELSSKYQLLEDGSLNKACVEECLEKAIEIYRYINFSDNILLVYENFHGIDDKIEKKFLESTFIQLSESESYRLKWQDPIDEDDLLIHEDNEVYTCIRNLYHVKKININKLFKEIILSDIGGKMNFASSIFIIDINNAFIFYLYDDRGIRLYSIKEENLTQIREKIIFPNETLDRVDSVVCHNGIN